MHSSGTQSAILTCFTIVGGFHQQLLSLSNNFTHFGFYCIIAHPLPAACYLAGYAYRSELVGRSQKRCGNAVILNSCVITCVASLTGSAAAAVGGGRGTASFISETASAEGCCPISYLLQSLWQA